MENQSNSVQDIVAYIETDLKEFKAPEKGYVIGFHLAGVPFLFHKYFWTCGFFLGLFCTIFVDGSDTVARFAVPMLIGLLGTIIIIFVHELGHFTAAKMLGVPLKATVFFPKGGVVILKDPMRRGLFRRLLVLAAGVLAQLLLLLPALYIPLNDPSFPLVSQSFYLVLVLGNLLIAVLNLIPFPGSDGQQMLAVLLHEVLLKMGADDTTGEPPTKAEIESKGNTDVKLFTHTVQPAPLGNNILPSIEVQASLEFELSKTEFIQGSNYLITHGDYKNNQNPQSNFHVIILNQVALFLLPLAAFALALFCNLSAAVALLFSLLVFLPVICLSLRSTLLLEKLRDYDANGPMLGERTIAINQQHVLVVNKFGTSHYEWDNVKKIVKSPDYILILIDMFNAHIIPTRVFHDEAQQKSFMTLLEAYDSSDSKTNIEL